MRRVRDRRAGVSGCAGRTVLVLIAAALAITGCSDRREPQGMLAPGTVVSVNDTSQELQAPTEAPTSPETVAGLALLASDLTSDVLHDGVEELASVGVPAPADFLYGPSGGGPTMQATIWWVVQAESEGGPKGAQAAMTLLLSQDMEPLTERDSVAIDGGSMYCQQVRDPASQAPQVSCGFYRDGLQGMVSSFDGWNYDESVQLLTTAVADLSAANGR